MAQINQISCSPGCHHIPPRRCWSRISFAPPDLSVCFSVRLPQHFGSTFGWLFMLSGLDAHCLSLPPACYTSLFKSQWDNGTRHKRCPDWPPTAPEVGRPNAIKQGTSVRAGPCGPRTAAAWGHSHCAGPQCTAVEWEKPDHQDLSTDMEGN